jgi:hypothetical protein
MPQDAAHVANAPVKDHTPRIAAFHHPLTANR